MTPPTADILPLLVEFVSVILEGPIVIFPPVIFPAIVALSADICAAATALMPEPIVMVAATVKIVSSPTKIIVSISHMGYPGAI